MPRARWNPRTQDYEHRRARVIQRRIAMHESSKASIETYHALVLSGQAQRNQDKIMVWILKYHKGRIITRHVIARNMGMAIQTVCGGVGRLVDDKYVKQDRETISDPITGNSAHRLYPIFPQPEQRTFTWPT